MAIKLNQQRAERFLAPDIHLRSGAGNGINGDFDACMMQAVDWLAGGDGITDGPECASRVIGNYCIRLNDSYLFRKHRDVLKPYALKLVGTAASSEVERKRAYICADYANRVFAPIWFRAVGKDEWATRAEAIAAVTDKDSAINARDIMRAIREAAADAADAYAADADADAADAANAADAAAAYAAADAADAAYAAAYAADAADAANAADAADAAYAAYAADAADARRCIMDNPQYGDALRAKTLECLDTLIACNA